MTVLGHEGIDTKAADYKALMTKISTSNDGNPPDAIFVGMVVDSNASQLLKDKVAIMGDNTKVKSWVLMVSRPRPSSMAPALP